MSIFKAGRFELPCDKRTYIMGILNVTPDSFSDGGKWLKIDTAVEHAIQMQNDGADIIDIGAQSTRPGFIKVSPQEELERLLPVLQALQRQLNIPISVDTFYPEVAEKALYYGIDIINDVSGFADDKMLKLASTSNCGCIVMHNGPATQTKNFFKSRLEKMLSMDISQERICFDPGIGFGKTYAENLSIIKNLQDYSIDGCSMLVGVSRKKVIGASCGEPPFEERLPGTIAANTLAVAGGANIIRVHDVKETVQAAQITDAILKV